MAKVPFKNITIIWHLGFQKTGTTIFQSLMRRNEDELSEFACVFPKQNWTIELQKAGLAYWDDPTSETEAVLSEAAKAIRGRVQDADKTYGIVSDENVIGLELFDEKGGMIDMAAKIMPILEKAVAPAKSEFVFYTRDFEKWFKSAYNQVVKQLRCRADEDEWRSKAPFSTDWEEHHKTLSSAVTSPVIFRDLKEDGAEGLPMGGHILQRAGVPVETLQTLRRPIGKNESLSPGALKFMRELNRSHIHDRGLEIVRRKMLQNPDAFS